LFETTWTLRHDARAIENWSLPNEIIASDGALYVDTRTTKGTPGLIERVDGAWTLQPPIISALGLCNELERPHVIIRNARYYLFLSTQRHGFAPDGPSGPNGLYGAVADALRGPYRPLNATGLVAANPASEPTQSYSWLVLDTLEVISFVDYWGMAGRALADVPDLVRSNFGGTAAPSFQIALDGDTSQILALPIA
jgi:levansucrase